MIQHICLETRYSFIRRELRSFPSESIGVEVFVSVEKFIDQRSIFSRAEESTLNITMKEKDCITDVHVPIESVVVSATTKSDRNGHRYQMRIAVSSSLVNVERRT